ncbi:MAG: efflux RND transporter permease subunit, partial [Calditrichota bacterium]
FMPLVLMSGIMGKFMRIIPIVVSLTLLASLVEVFFVAPSHFAEWGSRSAGGSDSRWYRILRRKYTHVLVWFIRRRYFIGPAVILLMLLLAMMIPLVGVELFKGDEFSQFYVWVTMPPGTPLEETDRVVRRVENIARSLPPEEVHAVIASAGIQQQEADWIYADHVGQVIVDLVEHDLRKRKQSDIIAEVRQKVQKIEGPLDVRLAEMSGGPPVGKAVEIKVKGKFLDELGVVAGEVKSALASIPGVIDIGDDNLSGKQEIKITVDENRAAMHGLSAAQIAMEVRGALDGIESSKYFEGDEDITIRVKATGSDAYNLDDLRKFPLSAPTGSILRLEQVCDFEIKPTLFRIRRFERERTITVSANVDKQVTSAIAVNQEISRRFSDLGARHPGYRLDFRGQFKEFEESFSELGRLFGLGVIIIFTILGAQFKSVRQSTIILLTIPFAFIGSMIGLLVNQNPFSIVAMYGMVALAGIAVNDAIVMLSFINGSRAAGSGRWRSIIQSGRQRLRPILLTSLTTILGLLPMALGLGGRSESWMPLANCIIWGLGAATLLTLLVIPSVYTVVVDEAFGLTLLKKRLFKT